MAQIIWTEPALADLEAIADYIAIENSTAAAVLVQRVFEHVTQLALFPESGSKPTELGPTSRYRQIVEPPCRVIYRFDGSQVLVLSVMRTERPLRLRQLYGRATRAKI